MDSVGVPLPCVVGYQRLEMQMLSTNHEMTDTEIIKAVAEFHGYTDVDVSTETGEWSTDGMPNVEPLQPYLTSLDAIVPVCEKLSDDQWQDFFIHLARVARIGKTNIARATCDATARQRCEALLRTLNLWKE